MFDVLYHGRVEPDRLRMALASMQHRRLGRSCSPWDVSSWLRLDCPTSRDRLLSHRSDADRCPA